MSFALCWISLLLGSFFALPYSALFAQNDTPTIRNENAVAELHSSATPSNPTRPTEEWQIERILKEENERWREVVESYESKMTGLVLIAAFMILLLVTLIFYHFHLQLRYQKSLEAQNLTIRQKNIELQDSYKAIEEANQTKDRLLSIISHNIRSPLASLSAFLKLIEENAVVFSPEEIQKLSHDLQGRVENLGVFMNNLLKWAQVQSGKINYRPTEIEVQTVAQDIQNIYDLELKNKQIRLNISLQPPASVWADEQMFHFILRNLVSNAIKFTPRNGEIRISNALIGNQNRISVSDTGVGMTLQEIQTIFQSKKYFTKQGTESEQGTGLGLVVCKEFVEQNGGTIEVESEVGKGTSFHILLPLGSSATTQNNRENVEALC